MFSVICQSVTSGCQLFGKGGLDTMDRCKSSVFSPKALNPLFIQKDVQKVRFPPFDKGPSGFSVGGRIKKSSLARFA